MNKAKEKRPDYLVMVNLDNRLPDGFEDSFELISVKNEVGAEFRIEKKTYDAFLRLQKDVLKNDGIQIALLGSYRTVKEQEKIFGSALDEFGMEYTCKYVARPGHSEHHTGLAIDVGIVIEGKLLFRREDLLSVDGLFQTVQKKLPEYGFILRYPKGGESVTKIAYEPWHYRYIDSPRVARQITDEGICFEQYLPKA